MQDFKEHTDAEGVISLPTSDFHKPICMEMRMARIKDTASQLGLIALPPPPIPPHPLAIMGPPVGLDAPSTTTNITFDTISDAIFSVSEDPIRRTDRRTKDANLLTATSSSTSSSYGTTTTTIALPIETPLRYPHFTSISNNNYNNFYNNYNNNFNTISSAGVGNYTTGGSPAFAANNINNNFHPNNLNNNNADLASVDSSDTYASCQTHPFFSQGDLTADLADEAITLDIDIDNLYINPLEKDSASTSQNNGVPTSSSSIIRSQVKKSASGDTALRNISTSAMDDTFQNFEVLERGSRVSLNEASVPKHRKTRFQQSSKPRARFEDSKLSQESLSQDTNKKKRSSFMPTKSLATATKLINQHLFGIQNVGARGEYFLC